RAYEFGDRVGEGVVVVAGGGVRGVADLDHVGMRYLVEEFLDRLCTDHIGHAAAHQQHRDAQGAGGGLEQPGHGVGVGVVAAPGDHVGVPVPVPATVTVTKVAQQPVVAGGPRPVRHVRGNSVGGLLDGVETVAVLAEE